MRISRLLPLLAAALVFGSAAHADVLIRIDKSAQIMTVTVDGAQRYAWPVSTGAPGYDTPSGDFKPFRMEAEHFSREWDDAPMPHSIFFTQQGHAIHGSSHIKAIGTPPRAHCVRLEPRNASILFALVKQQQMANTRVVLTGETPGSAGVPMARRDNPSIMTDEDDYTGARDSMTVPLLPGWRGFKTTRAYYYRRQPYYPPPRAGTTARRRRTPVQS